MQSLSRARLAAAALLVPALSACGAGISYNYDYDRSADFTRLRTYVWAQHPEGAAEPRGMNPMLERRFIAAIDQQLAAKGYQLSTSGEGDFAVNFQITTSEQVDYNTYYTGMGYRGGWYGGMGMGTSTTRATVTTNGTLIVDVFDVRSRELIWRGTAQGTVEPEASPEQREMRINQAVTGILQQFPSRTPAATSP
jgi:hypothetical protein